MLANQLTDTCQIDCNSPMMLRVYYFRLLFQIVRENVRTYTVLLYDLTDDMVLLYVMLVRIVWAIFDFLSLGDLH